MPITLAEGAAAVAARRRNPGEEEEDFSARCLECSEEEVEEGVATRRAMAVAVAAAALPSVVGPRDRAGAGTYAVAINRMMSRTAAVVVAAAVERATDKTARHAVAVSMDVPGPEVLARTAVSSGVLLEEHVRAAS